MPATSHFARVLVAADYRMKRLAMNFEPAPVRGLPSFLHDDQRPGRGHEQHAAAVVAGAEVRRRCCTTPTVWPGKLRGGSVKAMTEEDFLTASGGREHTGKANPVAQKWADNMTAQYDELAVAVPIFGELRNCMELAIVGHLDGEGESAGQGRLQPAGADGLASR